MTPSVRRNHQSLAISVAGLVLSGIVALSLRPGPAIAAANIRVDLSPEPAAAVVGLAVTLTVTAQEANGTPVAGAPARVYFVSGPDDTGGHGNSPDFACTTGVDGTCTISYSPVAVGTDVVCAVVTGSPFQCDEPVDAPEFDNNVDVIEVVVTLGGGVPVADPTPSADPTVAPDPTTAPTAVPDPTAAPPASATSVPDPTTAPTSVPDPTVPPTTAPDPTTVPTAVPDPTAAPPASPTSVPDPTTAPTSVPDPTTVPTAVPDPTAAPSASPTSMPDPTAASTPRPVSEPTATPAAGPTDTPAPAATPTTGPGNSPAGTASPQLPLPLTGAVVPGTTPPPGAAATNRGSSTTPTDKAKGDGGGFLGTVLSGIANRLGETVRPEAVEAIARTFGFPLALALLVILFLLVQDRLDHRDPKLRHAPRSAGETYIAFEEES